MFKLKKKGFIKKIIMENKRKIYEIEYDETVIFKKRITRFTVSFEFKNKESNLINANENFAHLHDSGRLEELLLEGHELLIKYIDKEGRKTKWDVIAVKINKEIILINSAFHRYIAENILKDEKISPLGKVLSVKSEVKYKKSRLDFYVETKKEKIYIETKGCTLVENGIAKFPGAPSSRAIKHLNDLMELKEKGFRAVVFILIFRKSSYFQPENKIDPLFAETFYNVMEKGVEVYPLLLDYKDKKVIFERKIEILEKSF